MSAAPFLLTGEPLRRMLTRTIERETANDLRAWKRRHWPRQIARGWQTVLVLCVLFWCGVALVITLALLDL